MKTELAKEFGQKFLRYMENHGFVRASGTIDGTTGNFSLGIRESRRGDRTKEHEVPAIRVDFTPKEEGKNSYKIIMRVRDVIETPVSSLQAMVEGAAMITRTHDWAREHGTILEEQKDREGRYYSDYILR